VIERHSRLSRVLNLEALSDLAEGGPPETLAQLAPIFDAVREYELVHTSGGLEAVDDARLFEALVYRVGRYLFMNDERRALAGHDPMLPRDISRRSTSSLRVSSVASSTDRRQW